MASVYKFLRVSQESIFAQHTILQTQQTWPNFLCISALPFSEWKLNYRFANCPIVIRAPCSITTMMSSNVIAEDFQNPSNGTNNLQPFNTLCICIMIASLSTSPTIASFKCQLHYGTTHPTHQSHALHWKHYDISMLDTQQQSVTSWLCCHNKIDLQ